MIVSPQNKVIVRVKSKYISNFSDLMRVAALQNNTSVHLEDLVQIVSEVVSLPRTISNERHYKGYTTDGIKVGDTIIMSFSVIYDHLVKDPYAPPLYKNLITYQGNEVWSADIRHIYGVIDGDEIRMVNGYVMATQYLEDKIFLQGTSKKSKNAKCSEIMHVSHGTISQGDQIYFNPMRTQKYQINNKHFVILKQDKILGVVKKKKVKQLL